MVIWVTVICKRGRCGESLRGSQSSFTFFKVNDARRVMNMLSEMISAYVLVSKKFHRRQEYISAHAIYQQNNDVIMNHIPSRNLKCTRFKRRRGK